MDTEKIRVALSEVLKEHGFPKVPIVEPVVLWEKDYIKSILFEGEKVTIEYCIGPEESYTFDRFKDTSWRLVEFWLKDLCVVRTPNDNTLYLVVKYADANHWTAFELPEVFQY